MAKSCERQLLSHPEAPLSPIAQSVEHLTVNQRVVGSSPTWGAKSQGIHLNT